MIETNPFFTTTIADHGLAPLAALLALALLVGGLHRYRKPRRKGFGQTRLRPNLHLVPQDHAMTQLAAVNASGYKTIPLLNREEARILPLLESLVQSLAPTYRVMAQTSLGEVIRPTGHAPEAFSAINAKRLDFAIIAPSGHLVIAIEHQGSGHHQNGAFLRDAVKREALRKAGVAWIETTTATTETLLRTQITDALTLKRSA